jgi:hypothetical protein
MPFYVAVRGNYSPLIWSMRKELTYKRWMAKPSGNAKAVEALKPLKTTAAPQFDNACRIAGKRRRSLPQDMNISLTFR